jgi:hypothetical protein
MHLQANRLVPLFALACLACGDAPRPASRELSTPTPAASSELPPGHPPLNPLPAGHPQVGGGAANQAPELNDPSQFAGRALLKGELATATQGRIIVSLRQKGMRMPLWAYVLDLADPELEKKGLQPAVGGTRELIFALNKDTTILPSPLPKGVELEVEVAYDADGSVDTRDDSVSGVVDAKPGDLGLEIVLEKPVEPGEQRDDGVSEETTGGGADGQSDGQ